MSEIVGLNDNKLLRSDYVYDAQQNDNLNNIITSLKSEIASLKSEVTQLRTEMNCIPLGSTNRNGALALRPQLSSGAEGAEIDFYSNTGYGSHIIDAYGDSIRILLTNSSGNVIKVYNFTPNGLTY